MLLRTEWFELTKAPFVRVYAAGDSACGICRYATSLARTINEDAKQGYQNYLSPGSFLPRPGPAIYNAEVVESILHPERVAALLVQLFARKLLGYPQIVIVHSVFTEAVLHARHPALRHALLAFQRLWLAAISRAAHVVVQTLDGRNRLRSDGIPAAFVQHGTFSPGRHASARDVRLAWGASEEDTIVGMIGHPYQFKGYARLLESMAASSPSDLSGLFLAYVGGEPARDRAEWQRIERAFDAVPVKKHVTGPLSDQAFADAVGALDVALLPYEDRPQASGVLASVAAAGIPCVVSRASIFADVISAGAAAAVDDSAFEASGIAAILRTLDLAAMRVAMERYASSSSLVSAATELRRLLAPTATISEAGLL